MKPSSLLILAVATTFLSLAGCGKKDSDTDAAEDSSSSGAAAGSVGSALASSGANGSQAMIERARLPFWRALFEQSAFAATACPTLKSGATGCTAVLATSENLTYSSCSFGSSAASWSGTLQVGVTGTGNTITCGTFPFTATSTGTITRQFVNGSNQPATGTRTSVAGTAVTIDHATANLGNYQSDTIAANIGTGYGSVVTWSAGKRTAVSVLQHVSSTKFDHSISGQATVTETAGATSRTVSGSLTVYHNKAKVKGTSTFTSVVYNDTCCAPVSGSISTAFVATSQSGTVGAALAGKTETLLITGCGTGTLTDATGASSAVTIGHCL